VADPAAYFQEVTATQFIVEGQFVSTDWSKRRLLICILNRCKQLPILLSLQGLQSFWQDLTSTQMFEYLVGTMWF
jgi:hypothetical protein